MWLKRLVCSLISDKNLGRDGHSASSDLRDKALSIKFEPITDEVFEEVGFNPNWRENCKVGMDVTASGEGNIGLGPESLAINKEGCWLFNHKFPADYDHNEK